MLTWAAVLAVEAILLLMTACWSLWVLGGVAGWRALQKLWRGEAAEYRGRYSWADTRPIHRNRFFLIPTVFTIAAASGILSIVLFVLGS